MKPLGRCSRHLFVALGALVLAAAGIWAQTGDTFDLRWSTVDTGGGSRQGGTFTLTDTAGQPDAQTLGGGPYTLSGGFWGYYQLPLSPTPTSTATPTASPVMLTPTATPTGSPVPPTPTATSTGSFVTPSPTPSCQPNYDLDENTQINASDLLLVIEDIQQGNLRSDFNCDGRADYQDLLLFSEQWEG